MKHLIEENREFIAAIIKDVQRIIAVNTRLLEVAPTYTEPGKIIVSCEEIILIAKSIMATIESHIEYKPDSQT